MSAKGISPKTFYNNMECNATAYVLCGVAVIVILNLYSKYVAKPANPKGTKSPGSQGRNGVTFPAGKPAADDARGHGERGDAGDDVDDASGHHRSPMRNGISGGVKSEQANDREAFMELRSTATKNDCELKRTPRPPNSVGVDEQGAAEENTLQEEGPHVVHLLDNGWSEEDLDVAQCPIEVYSWFPQRQSCGCSFELAVILQDRSRRRIVGYHHGSESCKPTEDVYKKVSLIFENYGAGVRYVTYTHKRRKPMDSVCKENCDSKMYIGLRKLLKINNLQ